MSICIRRALVAVVALLLAAQGSEESHAQTADLRALVPVARAADDMAALMPFPFAVKDAEASTDLQTARAWLNPFGLLDVQVTRALDASEASKLKNFYLGICGGALKIDTAKLANAFHCGPGCTRSRRDASLAHLAAARTFAESIRRAPNLRIVAHGGRPGRFRVNNAFVIGAVARQAIPSPLMGLVPSGRWRPDVGVAAYYVEAGIREAEVQALVEGLSLSSFVAIERREDDSVRVFLPGLGANTAGLLFLAPNLRPPVLGDKPRDGLEYTVLEQVSPSVWYFETT